MRLSARRIVPVAVAVAVGAVVVAPPASAALPSGWRFYLQIEDNVALPGQQLPDRVSGGYSSDVPFPGPGDFPDGRDLLTVERNGVVIGRNPGPQYVDGLDLRDGDEFVFRRADEPGRPEVARFSYRAFPRLDTPVCADEATYGGVLDERSTDFIDAEAVFWQPASELPPVPKDDPLGDYPGWTALPWFGYPGEYPGYGATERIAMSATADVPRFTVTPSKPLRVGTHIYVRSVLVAPLFAVNSRVDQVVTDCTVPPPLPTPAVPTLTPAPQSQSVLRPPGDVTPPKATLSVTKTRELRKLGLTKLVRGGLPIKVTASETARLVGTLTLLGGKAPFVSTVSIAVPKGSFSARIVITPTMRNRIVAAKRPRLRVELALVDAAGNRTPLPPAAVFVPGR